MQITKEETTSQTGGRTNEMSNRFIFHPSIKVKEGLYSEASRNSLKGLFDFPKIK